jgi:hypothetical protein
MASFSAVVALFTAPFGLPIPIRSSGILPLFRPHRYSNARTSFLPMRKFCAFPTCHTPHVAPTLHQACKTQA